MPLRITVLPASTQAGKETIRALLNEHGKDIQVHGIYRDLSKAPVEFTDDPRFSTGKGDVTGISELDLKAPDAVFYIPPPIYDGTDTAEHAHVSANKVKAAIERAACVKRLVILSAVGAHYEKGVGSLSLNHITDKLLKNSAAEVVIARPSWFQDNWAGAFKTDPPVLHAYLTPVDYKVPMISLLDIGRICAQKLLETGTSLTSSPFDFKIFGPRDCSALDIRDALEAISGKKVEVVAIEPDQLVNFFKQEVPEVYAEGLAEMAAACRPDGIIAQEMEKEDDVWRGSVELIDTLRAAAEKGTTKVGSGAF